MLGRIVVESQTDGGENYRDCWCIEEPAPLLLLSVTSVEGIWVTLGTYGFLMLDGETASNRTDDHGEQDSNVCEHHGPVTPFAGE